MHRFFVPQKNIGKKMIEITDMRHVHQIRNVLRMKIGDQFCVFAEEGQEYLVELAMEQQSGFVAKILDQKEKFSRGASALDAISVPELTLYMGLLKKDKFEWVLEKGTEIGVNRFVPLITDHTIKRVNKIPARWQIIVEEATEKCGRTRIPILCEPALMSDMLEKNMNFISQDEDSHQKDMLHFFFHPQAEENFSLKFCNGLKKYGIWIGPEGGFSRRELDWARKQGFLVLSLGTSILRAETAAIVFSAHLQFLSQQL